MPCAYHALPRFRLVPSMRLLVLILVSLVPALHAQPGVERGRPADLAWPIKASRFDALFEEVEEAGR